MSTSNCIKSFQIEKKTSNLRDLKARSQCSDGCDADLHSMSTKNCIKVIRSADIMHKLWQTLFNQVLWHSIALRMYVATCGECVVHSYKHWLSSKRLQPQTHGTSGESWRVLTCLQEKTRHMHCCTTYYFIKHLEPNLYHKHSIRVQNVFARHSFEFVCVIQCDYRHNTESDWIHGEAEFR